MIQIRHAERGDMESLKAMHREQGFEYELPDFDRPDWIVRAVLEREPGHPEMAMLLRRTSEAYLLIGAGSGKGRERIGKILALQKEVTDVASKHLYRDVHAWLPPEIERSFGRHLLKHCWVRPMWTSYVREL